MHVSYLACPVRIVVVDALGKVLIPSHNADAGLVGISSALHGAVLE